MNNKNVSCEIGGNFKERMGNRKKKLELCRPMFCLLCIIFRSGEDTVTTVRRISNFVKLTEILRKDISKYLYLLSLPAPAFINYAFYSFIFFEIKHLRMYPLSDVYIHYTCSIGCLRNFTFKKYLLKMR